MLGCGEKVARVLLILFNIVFFLCGAALLGVGIWVRVDTSGFVKIMSLVTPLTGATVGSFDGSRSFIEIAAYIMIALGGFTFIVGFCGCCGAWKENKVLLIIYLVLLLIIVAGQITIGVLAGVFKKEVDKLVKDALGDILIPNYNGFNGKDKPDAISGGLDVLMITSQCCGISGSTDFAKSVWGKNTPNYFAPGSTTAVVAKAPVACCKFSDTSLAYKWDFEGLMKTIVDKDCPLAEDKTAVQRNINGCFDVIINKLQQFSVGVLAVAFGLGLLELLGVVFACCLIGAIGRK